MANKPHRQARGKPRKQQSPAERPVAERREQSKQHLDELLDEGVEETFPASDPVSVRITR